MTDFQFSIQMSLLTLFGCCGRQSHTRQIFRLLLPTIFDYDCILLDFSISTLQPFDPGPDFVQDDSHFGALQFIADEVQSVLPELDVSKGASSDGIPPIILLRICFCTSTFSSF
jgi:hypothetical protein